VETGFASDRAPFIRKSAWSDRQTAHTLADHALAVCRLVGTIITDQIWRGL